MKRCFVVLAIGFSVAVMAAQSGYGLAASVDVATRHWTDAQRTRAPVSIPQTFTNISLDSDGSFVLAQDGDLRNVERNTVSNDRNGREDAKASVMEDKNADDEAAEKGDEEQDDKGEGEDSSGGWDRLWDGPKLG